MSDSGLRSARFDRQKRDNGAPEGTCDIGTSAPLSHRKNRREIAGERSGTRTLCETGAGIQQVAPQRIGGHAQALLNVRGFRFGAECSLGGTERLKRGRHHDQHQAGCDEEFDQGEPALVWRTAITHHPALRVLTVTICAPSAALASGAVAPAPRRDTRGKTATCTTSVSGSDGSASTDQRRM